MLSRAWWRRTRSKGALTHPPNPIQLLSRALTTKPFASPRADLAHSDIARDRSLSVRARLGESESVDVDCEWLTDTEVDAERDAASWSSRSFTLDCICEGPGDQHTEAACIRLAPTCSSSARDIMTMPCASLRPSSMPM